jgi:cystathionine beta-lyase/cystathionine gamma-synthase
MMRLCDLATTGEIAQGRALFVVDNTFATPVSSSRSIRRRIVCTRRRSI